MLKLMLTPNRDSSPWGYTRTVRYEFKVWEGFEWSGDSGPIGASLIPVVTLKEFRGGKFQAVRVTERPKIDGIWKREWPFIPRDARFVPANVPTHEPPEPKWLKDARLDAVSEAGDIRCGTCGFRRRNKLGIICSCKAIDSTTKRDYIIASTEEHAAIRHSDGPTVRLGGHNGRNDSRGGWDDQSREDSRAVEKATRERRRNQGKGKSRSEV